MSTAVLTRTWPHPKPTQGVEAARSRHWRETVRTARRTTTGTHRSEPLAPSEVLPLGWVMPRPGAEALVSRIVARHLADDPSSDPVLIFSRTRVTILGTLGTDEDLIRSLIRDAMAGHGRPWRPLVDGEPPHTAPAY